MAHGQESLQPPFTHCQVEEGLISLAVRMSSALFGVSSAIGGGGMAELNSAAVLSSGGIELILVIVLHVIMLSVVRGTSELPSVCL